MFTLIAAKYYWSNIRKDIEEFIESCSVCQQRKKLSLQTKFQLYRIVPPSTMFQLLGMDTLALPKSIHGDVGVHTIIDYTSGTCAAFRIREHTSAVIIKNLTTWRYRYGVPSWIVCDNASYFKSFEILSWAANLNIQIIPGAGYNPHGNGKCEKFNDRFVTFLAKRVIDSGDRISKWPKHVDGAVFDCNNQRNRDTGLSAFQFTYGQNPRFPTDPVKVFTEEEFIGLRREYQDTIERLRVQALQFQEDAQRKSIAEMEMSRSPQQVYAIGDHVWVWKDKLEQTVSSDRKIENLWDGPLQIKKMTAPGTYECEYMNGAPYRDSSVSHIHLRPVTYRRNVVEDKLDVSIPTAFFDDTFTPSYDMRYDDVDDDDVGEN
jgi:transposase InsO family protein